MGQNVNELHNELKELQAEMVRNSPTWSYEKMKDALEKCANIRKEIENQLNIKRDEQKKKTQP